MPTIELAVGRRKSPVKRPPVLRCGVEERWPSSCAAAMPSPGRWSAIPGCGRPSSHSCCSTGRRTGARSSSGSICCAGHCRCSGKRGAVARSRPAALGDRFRLRSWVPHAAGDSARARHRRHRAGDGPACCDGRLRPRTAVVGGHLIDGLADGGAALLCKVNHALTDGSAGFRSR